MARGKAPAVSIPAYIRRRFFDRETVDTDWRVGFVRDIDPPPGTLYDAVDFITDQWGKVYRRGGWQTHSPSVTGASTIKWVSTLHIPTRVMCIDNTFNLSDVTSENAPSQVAIGNVGFFPLENSPQFVDRIILTDGACVLPPKIVRYNPTPDSLVIENFDTRIGLGTSPPVAQFSTVFQGVVVLGRGPRDYGTTNDPISRIYFGLTQGDLKNGLTAFPKTDRFFDMSYEITGLAAIGGVMLVFSPQHVERILTGAFPSLQDPPDLGSMMKIQPFLGVGCTDARSILYVDEGIIFAGEDGVYLTNGSNVESLTQKANGTGIQSYWRSLFPRHVATGLPEKRRRQIISGLLNQDFMVVTILDSDNLVVDNLLCFLPERAWTRLSNVHSNSYAHGRDEYEIGECYGADSTRPYVNRMAPMVYPGDINGDDGDGNGPSPYLITRNLGEDNPGMKAYGFGWLSYMLQILPNYHPAWQANHAYTGQVIQVTIPMDFRESPPAFFTGTTGTSGPTEPLWWNARNPGDSIVDGGVTWTNTSPSMKITALRDLGRWIAKVSPYELSTTGLSGSSFYDRRRFQIFADTQALWIKVEIMRQGVVHAEIQQIEVEDHPYWYSADSRGA